MTTKIFYLFNSLFHKCLSVIFLFICLLFFVHLFGQKQPVNQSAIATKSKDSFEEIDRLIELGQDLQGKLLHEWFKEKMSEADIKIIDEIGVIGIELEKISKINKSKEGLANAYFFHGIKTITYYIQSHIEFLPSAYPQQSKPAFIAKLDSAMILFEEINQKNNQYLALNHLIEFYHFFHETFEEELLNSINYSIKEENFQQDSFLMARSFYYLGFLTRHNSYYKTITYFEKAKNILEQLPENSVNLLYYEYVIYNLGYAFQRLKINESAIPYFEKSLELAQERNDSMNIAWTRGVIAQLYYYEGDFESARPYINKIDSILQYANFKDKILLAYLNNVIGIEHQLKEDNALAISYLEKVIEIEKEIIEAKEKMSFNIAEILYSNYNCLQKIAHQNENLGDAESYALKAYEYAKMSNDYENISSSILALKSFYQKKNDREKYQFYYNAENEILEKVLKGKHQTEISRLNFEVDGLRTQYEVQQKEQQKLQLQIQKRTNFFFLGVLAFSIILISLLFYFSKKNSEMAEKEIQLRTSTLKHFANISHEFRTPLAILKTPLEQLNKGQFKGNINHIYAVLLSNVDQLVDLVNQVLDLTKTKESQLRLNRKYDNPIEFLPTLVEQFSTLAKHKKIDLILKIPTQSISLHFDKQVITKILNNLIYNALKFTKEGVVRVEFEYFQKYFEVKVADTGNGISAESLPYIFERYYRSPIDRKQSFTGGLGLSLVKELVSLYEGKIIVKSELNKGTIFTIQLPFEDEIELDRDASEFKELNLSLSAAGITTIASIPIEVIPPPFQCKQQHTDFKKILVIEDNIHLNDIICNQLSDYYRIYQAFDGESGFGIAQNEIPDLVLTDIMMPKMDGVEFAQKLSKSIATNHIPLIVISAYKDNFLANAYQKSNVVDFIQKPVNLAHLLSKINNLINTREQFRASVQKHGWIKTSSVTSISDDDRDFLNKLQSNLLDNISEEGLNIDKLSKMMLVSRVQLFRKIKSLTGMTPGKFIMKVKMQNAYELLEQHKTANITEIAARVGFNNLSFFSRKFKETYGISASDLKNKDGSNKSSLG